MPVCLPLQAEELGDERALEIPSAYKVLPVPTATQLDNEDEDSKYIVGKKIEFNWGEGFGWCSGVVLRRNFDVRRTVAGPGTARATFILKLDVDNGRTTAVVLKAEMYSSEPSAPVESWCLLEQVPSPPQGDAATLPQPPQVEAEAGEAAAP